ncbi:MAG: radical SAM protein [Methanosarcina sp.]|uniref:radical SAM protein n=1 Tax=Methanosarcina sp. TaxID=2213 RepID=UPI00260D195B|nr:radical SAM protein [Methanosarcina sp.]MDD3246533.1 radical SAM protein [Methanosarcina sp.]MDD4250416.1 radical SAM protein [Methanosarcina sp.]
MEKLTKDETGSFCSYLSEGCRLCQQGAKMVLFVTGLCPKSCFYCPLSDERSGKDLVFANERLVKSDEDLLKEAELMDALGTGITGGEPLIKVERVLYYIRLLKSSFGKAHHIHLYTSLAPDRETLEKLAEAGLDEIRFHPPQAVWGELMHSPYTDALRNAKALGMETGIEIPSLDGAEKVAAFAEEMGVFLNMNELEFSDNNSDALYEKGFSLESDTSCAAAGSHNYAEIASSTCKRVRFCSSTYKDAVQLRKRFQRIAKNTAREFDEITEDGTLIYGVINGGDQELAGEILGEIEVPDELYEVKEGKIEIAWWVLEDLKDGLKEELEPLGTKLFIIERHPFEDGMLVELIPL